jgi:hypothetical protein
MAEIDLSDDVVTVAATRADGGLTVSRFITQTYRAPTEEEIRNGAPLVKIPNGRPREITPEVVNEVYGRRLQLIAEGKKPPGSEIVTWEFVPNDYLDEDTDDTFRNAWVHEHGKGQRKPDHDMPKAREIQRVYLRKARIAEFDRLDNDYRIADEAGDQNAKKEIGTLRQKFRDVTDDPRIEQAQTVEELKALRLDVLVPETLGEKHTDKMRISPAIPGNQ